MSVAALNLVDLLGGGVPYIYIYIYINLSVCVCVCGCACVCACVYVCIYIYIYMYVLHNLIGIHSSMYMRKHVAYICRYILLLCVLA